MSSSAPPDHLRTRVTECAISCPRVLASPFQSAFLEPADILPGQPRIWWRPRDGILVRVHHPDTNGFATSLPHSRTSHRVRILVLVINTIWCNILYGAWKNVSFTYIVRSLWLSVRHAQRGSTQPRRSCTKGLRMFFYRADNTSCVYVNVKLKSVPQAFSQLPSLAGCYFN